MKKKLIIICVLIVLVAAGVVFFVFNNKKESKSNNEERKFVTQTEVDFMSEEEIVERFKVTKEFAIDIVKKVFNKESYQFDAEYDSGKYFIHVTDSENGEKFTIQFDPVDKSFFRLSSEE